MISKKQIITGYAFGVKISEIENFEDAILSSEKYICHHVLEWKYTVEELKKMKKYDTCTPKELIFLPISLHNGNFYLHKGNRNYDRSITSSGKKVKYNKNNKNVMKK